MLLPYSQQERYRVAAAAAQSQPIISASSIFCSVQLLQGRTCHKQQYFMSVIVCISVVSAKCKCKSTDVTYLTCRQQCHVSMARPASGCNDACHHQRLPVGGCLSCFLQNIIYSPLHSCCLHLCFVYRCHNQRVLGDVHTDT